MCWLQVAGGAICPAHMAPIRPPGGGFRNSRRRGVWHKILQALPDWGYTLGKGKVEAVAIDSTLVEAKKGGKVWEWMGIRSERGPKCTFW